MTSALVRIVQVATLSALLFSGLVRAEPPDRQAPFHFRHILVGDSTAHVSMLRLPPGGPPIGVDNLPLLTQRDFGDLLTHFIGQSITEQSLGQLMNEITGYVHAHGQTQVDVSLPPQNVASGDVRVVVVIGRFSLTRLLISDTEAKAAAMHPDPHAGGIVIEDTPSLATQEFAAAMAPHFHKPINDETLNAVANEIDRYARSHGVVIARIGVPKQDPSKGELRIAVTIGRFPLHRLIVAETAAAAGAVQVSPNSGRVIAPDLPLFQTKDFLRTVSPYLDRPITRDGIVDLRRTVLAFVKAHNRVALTIPDPQVDLPTGEVRLAVLIARYGQIHFQGNRWFSSRLLEQEIGVKPGQEVSLSDLEAAVNGANQNPFRHLQVSLNALNAQAMSTGLVAVDVAARERPPFRVSATYDDSGNGVIGNNHYSGSVELGNLWGRDHQLVYQFTTTDKESMYQAHLATYRAQLPWRDYIQVAAAYAAYDAPLEQGAFELKGTNLIGDLRYVHPWFGDTWSLEVSAGVDFKQIDTHLSFFGFNAYSAVNDIAQGTAGATYTQRDAHGAWVLALTGNLSPGNFDHRNTDRAFQGKVATDPTTGEPIGGPEAQARYIYGDLSLQRLINLPDDFQLLFRGQAQLSSARLLSSERLSIGGAATVRGYNERIMSADEGWAFTTEIHSPDLKLHVPSTPRQYLPMDNRLIAFFDDGRVVNRHPRPDDFPLHRLSSAGFGLRSNWASNFSLTADYGWQLEKTGIGRLAQPNRSRGDIQVTLSY